MIPGGFAYKAALEKFQGNAPLRAWNAGISAASKSRRWERGLGLAEALRQAALQASVVTHTAVINARPGRWRCASLLIGRIRRSGLQLDLIALGAFVASLEKGFQWRRALHRFGLATCWGLTPDRILYNSAISACEKCGAWSTAVALATTGMADVVSFTAAISACEKGGRWRVGISLLRALPARFLRPGVIGCNAAISACDKGGAWAHVMSIVRTFVKRDVAPDIISHTACFGAARSWERAMLLLSLLFSRSLRPDLGAGNSFLLALESGSQWSYAHTWLNRSASLAPNHVTLAILLSTGNNCRQWQASVGLFSASQSMRIHADMVTYDAAIGAHPSESWQSGICWLAAAGAAGLEPTMSSKNAAIADAPKAAWRLALHLGQPDARTGNAALVLLAWRGCLHLLWELQRRRQTDASTYSLAAQLCEGQTCAAELLEKASLQGVAVLRGAILMATG